MTSRVERASPPSQHVSRESAIEVLAELKAHLERRSRELNEEIRNYPTPIARCDEQLTKLIEQRSRAVEQMQLVAAADPSQAANSAGDGCAALEALLASPAILTDDEIECAIRSRARAVLTGLRPEAASHA